MFALAQVGQFSTGGVGQFYSGANNLEPTFQTTRLGDRDIIRIVGEVDIATAPRLRELIGEASPMNSLIVDLSDCAYADSSVLTVLSQASKTRGDRLIVVVPPDARIRKIFQITGLDRALNIRASLPASQLE
jgi:anti-sigma B factor antagonist